MGNKRAKIKSVAITLEDGTQIHKTMEPHNNAIYTESHNTQASASGSYLHGQPFIEHSLRWTEDEMMPSSLSVAELDKQDLERMKESSLNAH